MLSVPCILDANPEQLSASIGHKILRSDQDQNESILFGQIPAAFAHLKNERLLDFSCTQRLLNLTRTADKYVSPLLPKMLLVWNTILHDAMHILLTFGFEILVPLLVINCSNFILSSS